MKKNHRAGMIGLFAATAALCAALTAAALFRRESPVPPAAETTLPTRTTEAPPPAPSREPETVPPTQPALRENPYGMEDFSMRDGYLTCAKGESLLGVDVSAYQKDIDWTAVKNAGVEFVMLRVGFRGYGSSGSLNRDAAAQDHYLGAKAAGLKVGVYFFSQAVSVEEAREEAAFALSLLDGWQLDLPVAFDWEYISETARTAGTDARTVTDCAIAFCETVEAAGYSPMVYISQEQDRLILEELARYPLWAAWYSEETTYPWKTAFWQYTNTGSVPGIPGNADINLWLTA